MQRMVDEAFLQILSTTPYNIRRDLEVACPQLEERYLRHKRASSYRMRWCLTIMNHARNVMRL